MPQPFTYPPRAPLNLKSLPLWCLRLVLFAVGLVVAAGALATSMLLLVYVSARALWLRVAGRGRAGVRFGPSRRDVFRRGGRMAARPDVVDVEARSLP